MMNFGLTQITLLLTLLSCFCGFVALVLGIVALVLVTKKGKTTPTEPTVSNQPTEQEPPLN